MKKICEYCKEEFETDVKARKFCCVKHARAYAHDHKIGFFADGFIRKPKSVDN